MAESNISRPMNGYTTGDFRASKHANITEAERGYYRIIGRTVIVDLSFTVGTAITGDTTVIFSGLPKTISGSVYRFRVPSTNSSTTIPLRLSIDPNGNIANAYTNPGGIPVGTFECQFAYICE